MGEKDEIGTTARRNEYDFEECLSPGTQCGILLEVREFQCICAQFESSAEEYHH